MEGDSTPSTSSGAPKPDPLVLQRKLYFLNEQLQIMARDLPPLVNRSFLCCSCFCLDAFINHL